LFIVQPEAFHEEKEEATVPILLAFLRCCTSVVAKLCEGNLLVVLFVDEIKQLAKLGKIQNVRIRYFAFLAPVKNSVPQSELFPHT